jgi:hypothetical protein
MDQRLQQNKYINWIKANMHNIGLLIIIFFLYAIDGNILGIFPSLVIIGILLLGTIYGSFVFVSRIERTLLLAFYFYLSYMGINVFQYQFIDAGMLEFNARYVAFSSWTGLGFEDIKPIESVREYVIWASVYGYVANASLIAIFIRFCTPTWLILKEGE